VDEKRSPAYRKNSPPAGNLIIMEEFLKFLVTPLLSAPDKLQITNQGNSLILKVDDADVGRIIGKKGTIINALRTLVRTYCTVHQLQFVNLLLDTPQLPKKD
jgi:uncharacterized protein